MFDKIKKILGIEEKAEEQKDVKVNFNEILNFVKKETKEKQTEAKDKINESLNEILVAFEKIEQELADLKKSEPEAEIPRGRKFDFNIRNRLCDNVISAIKKLEKPRVHHDPVFDFLNDCEDVFKKFDDLSPKSSAWLMFLFQGKMKETGVLVKKTQEQIKELREFLNSEGMVMEIETRVKDIAGHIEKNEREIEMIEKELKGNEKEIAIHAEKVAAKKEELSQLNSGKEFFKLNELKNNIKNKEEEALQIEQQISTPFAGTHRIMKKFRYIDSGLDREFTKHLDSYLNSPAETYLNEKYDDSQNIHKILSKINKAVEKKEIAVSKRDHHKLTELMDFLEGGDLVKYKENYIKIKKEIKEKEQEYNVKEKPFKKMREKFAKELVKLNNNLDELKNTGNELKNNLNKFRTNFENNKDALENTASSAIGKVNVRIIYKNADTDTGS